MEESKDMAMELPSRFAELQRNAIGHATAAVSYTCDYLRRERPGERDVVLDAHGASHAQDGVDEKAFDKDETEKYRRYHRALLSDP